MNPTVTTATVETTSAQLARRLLAQLDDIHADQAMAARFIDAGSWRAELARERAGCWQQLTALLNTTPGGPDE